MDREVVGVIKEVEVLNWENFVMAMAHISDQFTFCEKYVPDQFRVVHARNRFVDYLMSPLQF